MDKSIYIEIRNRLKTLISGTEFENRVFFVGGCCRDDIMGCEIKDIDISVALPDGGIRLAQWLHAEGHTVSEPSVFHDFHTAKFRLAEYPGIELESVQTRKESYPDRESRNPVTSYGTHEEDCMRRDLTVNALYQNVSTGEIVDITGKGLDDIRDHIIRTPGDPYRTYDEDPLRILRCVRFAARFGWEIEKETLAAMKTMVPRMSILTPARISDEFLKMLQDDRPAMAVELLCEIKAIEYMFPCVPKADSVKALQRISSNTDSLNLRLAALLHGNQYQQEILESLRLPASEVAEMTFISACATQLQECDDLDDAALREMQFRSGSQDRFKQIVLLAEAMGNHRSAEDITERTAKMLSEGTAMFAYILPLTGKDIIEIRHMSPGPAVKILQRHLLKYAFKNPLVSREELKNVLIECKI